MPRIFDNIDTDLLPALEQTLLVSERADFCVGYFNLRGWKQIDSCVEKWSGGEGSQCRLLVGMQRLAQDELRSAYSLLPKEDQISQQAVVRLKRRLAEEFRAQLTFGALDDADEAGLRELGQRYLKDLDKNSTMLVREQKQTGTTETQSFKIQKSKPIIYEIDTALARHYGLTSAELDFIINYDIKYRLGRGTEIEDEM